MKRPRQTGVGYVGVHNSCHFGAAGYYVNLAAKAGMIGLAMANDIPSMVTPGARKPVLGTNPFSYAVPAGEENPIFLDIASSAVSIGRIRIAKALGQRVPDTWLVDNDGLPTGDASAYPEAAAPASFAGHKGYGIALMIEVLAGLLADGGSRWDISSWNVGDPKVPTNHGAAFLAIDIGQIVPLQKFKSRMDGMIRDIRKIPEAKGVDRVRVPGEMEWDKRREALAKGIPLPEDVRAGLQERGGDCGAEGGLVVEITIKENRCLRARNESNEFCGVSRSIASGCLKSSGAKPRDAGLPRGTSRNPKRQATISGSRFAAQAAQITPMSWKLINLFADPSRTTKLSKRPTRTNSCAMATAPCCGGAKTAPACPNTSIFSSKSERAGQEHTRPHVVDPKNYRRRIDFEHYRETLAECAEKKLFFTAGVAGAFDAMNELCGHEHVLVGMALDPDWIRDMVDVYSRVAVELLEMLFTEAGLPDGLWVWDDLGFKQRPFMSPAMYRELIFPAHKRLFDFAHSRGLPVILHCDGLVESLIPNLIEAGVDCLQPLEVKAGMDVLKIKKLYGDRLAFIGGMDARELLSNDLGRVQKELKTKVPVLMAGSGYVLQVDHSVPGGVDYETYEYFIKTGLKLGTY